MFKKLSKKKKIEKVILNALKIFQNLLKLNKPLLITKKYLPIKDKKVNLIIILIKKKVHQ